MATRGRTYKTHALVLRRRDYADADRILTVFTPRLGKLQVIAKGIRKTSSRKAGHLELFTHAMLQLAQARTWDIVTEAVTVENYRHLRRDLDAIGRASYVCELADSFTETDNENQPLWDLLTLTLRIMDDGIHHESHFEPLVLLRWFELHLLSLTGFQPQLYDCVGCGTELQPVTNYLSLMEGGVLCPKCRKQSADAEAIEPDVLKVLRYLQSRPWRDVAALTVREPIMRRMENILYRYLLTILERRLRSADFMRRLQSLSSQTTV